MNNSTVNKCVLGQIGFQSEIITVRSARRVVVTFDSFASHSSMSAELRKELNLNMTSLGFVDVQHYGGHSQEEGFQCTARIDGVSNPFSVGGTNRITIGGD